MCHYVGQPISKDITSVVEPLDKGHFPLSLVGGLHCPVMQIEICSMKDQLGSFMGVCNYLKQEFIIKGVYVIGSHAQSISRAFLSNHTKVEGGGGFVHLPTPMTCTASILNVMAQHSLPS